MNEVDRLFQMETDGSCAGSTKGVGISCWCAFCESYLFTAPNSWKLISKRAVTHSLLAYRSGDIEENMRRSIEEFEGANKLKDCSLKYLFCKGRHGTAQPCTTKLGLYCVSGSRSKRFKNCVFLMYKNLVLRRGKKYDSEPFNITGELSPDGKDTSLSKEHSTTSISAQVRPGSPDAQSEEPEESSAGDNTEVQVPGSPPPEAIPAATLAVSTHNIPIRASPVVAYSSGEALTGHTSSLQPAQRPECSSTTLNSGTLLAGSNQDLETTKLDEDDEDEDEEDLTGMIQIGKTDSPENEDLVQKVNHQQIQLQKQGLILEEQKKLVIEQQTTIQSLISRVGMLESKLKSQYDMLREQIAEVTRESKERGRELPAPSKQPVKRPFEQVEPGLKPCRSEVPPAPSGESTLDDTQAINAYLQETVREDDSEDEDYNPSQDKSQPASMSLPQQRLTKDSSTSAENRLFAQASALERSPHVKRARGRPRLHPQRQMRPLSFQEPPNSPPDPNTLGSGPNGHTGSIIRRGISGRAKAVPPELSRGTFSASKMDVDPNSSSTPTSFGPDPKRQRLDLGSGSFKSSVSASPNSGPVDLKGTRDAEGYLLKSNGQRDMRSIRGRTLGPDAFKPTSGERRTVANLMATGRTPTPTRTRYVDAKTTGYTASTPNPAAAGQGQVGTTTKRKSPPTSVTTINAYLADAEEEGAQVQAQSKPQRPVNVYEEVQRANQARIDSAMGRGKGSAKVYSDRHSAFMDKLKLG